MDAEEPAEGIDKGGRRRRAWIKHLVLAVLPVMIYASVLGGCLATGEDRARRHVHQQAKILNQRAEDLDDVYPFSPLWDDELGRRGGVSYISGLVISPHGPWQVQGFWAEVGFPRPSAYVWFQPVHTITICIRFETHEIEMGAGNRRSSYREVHCPPRARDLRPTRRP